MEETKLQNTNTFKVVGRLLSADVKEGISKSGSAYVSATATVQSVIGGVNNEFEIDFYSSKTTSAGKESNLAKSYLKMNELIGKKVEITGSLRENRYFSKNLNQIISAQELAGRFVKGVAETTVDDARWEIGGFVAKTLNERKNKKGEVYRYDVSVAQTNYSGTNLSMYTLHVDPSRREIIKGVENYNVGDTIRLNGVLNFLVETKTTEVNNDGGFGDPVVRTYTNRQKNFYIEGGSAPITDNSKYDGQTIHDLIDGYKARDVELSSDAKNSFNEVATETTPTITKRQTSLI